MRPEREFFLRDAVQIAPLLLGARLISRLPEGEVTLRITETEAYTGPGVGDRADPGSHSRMGKTARNASMFGEPGHLYVYFSYGLHHAVNVVCSPAGLASGVLLRAGEIITGVELARARRGAAHQDRDLARGPGRLAQALGFIRERDDGVDALDGAPGARAELLLAERVITPAEMGISPRTGVSGIAGTAEFPWRFYLRDEATVSPYRAAAPPRR